MKKWIKVTIGLVFTFIILIAAGGFIFYQMLQESLPLYSGDVIAPSVREEIEIYRDSIGTAYIYAKNEYDAAFAVGYAHAQERMFQMDIARRAGEGRLSEILGSRTLAFDKMFRTIGIKKIVDKNIKSVKKHTLDILKAYSDGVNSYLNDPENTLPVEFDILKYKPYPWKPEHSLIIGRMMAYDLNISWWTDIAFTHLAQKFGPEKASEIIPSYDEDMPVIIPANIKDISSLPYGYLKLHREYRSFMGQEGTHIGSNNWVVNGSKSVSGKAIIANDTHLSLGIPAKWYVVVVNSPEWSAAGFTLPGVPLIIIGKNSSIAWAVTNIMLDDTDFYNETIDSTGKNYLLDGKWLPLKKTKETIAVKDSSNVEFEITSTHRGPIITGIHPYDLIYDEKNIKLSRISMRWLGSEPSDEFDTFYRINKASGFQQFRQAFDTYSVPGQNFLYADNSNNIGYIFGGRLPVRGGNNISYIFDGSSSSSDWQRILNVTELPYVYNPGTNYLASANNKTLNNFPYHISNIWEPSSRFERITELITGKPKHSVKDYMRYQNDFVSPYARSIVPHILDAFRSVKINDENLREALELLEKWNYELDPLSQVPSIYAYFLKYLMRNLFLDEMKSGLFNEYVLVANVPYRKIKDILENPLNTWVDDINTPERENLEKQIRKSFVEGLSELEKRFGRNIAEWQWGSVHTLTLEHPFSGQSKLIDGFINIGPFGIGGDGTTLFNTEYPFNEPVDTIPMLDKKEFECTLGPSMRFIFDFADPGKFYMVLPSGQSGNILSDNYSNQTPLWLNGKYAVVSTNEGDIRSGRLERLIIRRK